MPNPTIGLSLRMSPELFQQMHQACATANVSMNAWVCDLIRASLGQQHPKKPTTEPDYVPATNGPVPRKPRH